MSHVFTSQLTRADHDRLGARFLIMTAVFLACGYSPYAREARAADKPPLLLEKSIAIPDVPTGPYSDSLAVDAVGHRVFATPQAAKHVAVLDVKEGCVVKTIPIGNPHGIFYSTQLKRLFVVDGASGDVKVFNGEDYSLVKTIRLTKGADSMTYDPKSQSLFVGNGGEDANMKQALVSVIDAVQMEKVADISVNTLGLEGLAVDSEKRILYVNLDENDKGVAVVDLNKREVVDTWKLPAGPHRSKAIAFDDAHARLFVVSRDTAMHGSIIVFNVANGKLVATLPVGGWADGISIDQKRRRIYVSTGLGYMETYAIESNDTYRRLDPVETAILGKTSIYSAELDRVYVDIPHVGSGSEDAAKVMIFRPTP